MSKTIEEVLTAEEIESIRKIEEEMRDNRTGNILEKIIHIECKTADEGVEVMTVETTKNPYEHLIYHAKERPIERTHEELRKLRLGLFKSLRGRILKQELHYRAEDIKFHKWHLSQRMGYDVGIVVAAAHWLKDISPDYYSQSQEDYARVGINFEWIGAEKAVVIEAPNKKGEEIRLVLIIYDDLFKEESFAQVTAGVANVNDMKRTKIVGAKTLCAQPIIASFNLWICFVAGYFPRVISNIHLKIV